ncbi:hypothetical protein C9J85_01145 [Haloferax sp. wsp5]|nr:hypothetical protein C9J85_01145 [Haloferax sp. wsp5]
MFDAPGEPSRDAGERRTGNVGSVAEFDSGSSASSLATYLFVSWTPTRGMELDYASSRLRRGGGSASI